MNGSDHMHNCVCLRCNPGPSMYEIMKSQSQVEKSGVKMNSRDLLLLASLYRADDELSIAHGFGASTRRLGSRGLLHVGPGGRRARISEKGRRVCEGLLSTIEEAQVDDAG